MENILDALPDDRTITWGDATFEIRKLLPTEAKPLFVRHVRPLLRGALSAEAPAEGATEPWRIMLAAFTDAPAEHYEAISKAMSRSIIVSRAGEAKPLAGNEEWAWQELEGVHAILLDTRAFVVNFKPWLVVVASELPQLVQAFESLSPPTSTDSSQPS